MDFSEAKQQFISSWGELGCRWGICKTMGHIHALLLISPEPLSSEQIIDELKISGGNANMNLRALMDWGLVYRKSIAGERKDFFEAEKDLWSVFKKTLHKRKERELNPMLKLVKDLSITEASCPKSKEFKRVVTDLHVISSAAEKSLDKLLKSESNILLNTILKVIR